MHRTSLSVIGGLFLLSSLALPALAMSGRLHADGGPTMGATMHVPREPVIGSLRGTPMHFARFVSKPSPVLPDSRKSCFRRRVRQLLALGHDLDLAEEEALLICG